jgi:hypothetical protein
LPEADKRNLRLVVEMLKASNRVERMSHEEIRTLLRQAAALLVQRPDDGPAPAPRPSPLAARRHEPVAPPTRGDLPAHVSEYDPNDVLYPPPEAPDRAGPNWRLFLLMFVVGFFGLVLVGTLFV